METAMMNSICRCCATEGVFKCVTIAYTWMGEEEIYADMLKECFDINLNLSESGEDAGICEVCITQLRNASNFKKQVLSTEEQLKKHAENKLFKPNIVKVEVTRNDDDSDDNMSAEEAYSGPEFEVPIKTETEESKPKKRTMATRASTSGAKKSKDDDAGETSTKRNLQKGFVSKEITDSSETEQEDLTTQNKITPRTDLIKHRSNIKEILMNSNATPIRRYGSIGYTCCFCEEQFTIPADLKKHTLETHKDISAANFMKSMNMSEYVVKLDITDLHCNICSIKMDSLETFMDHLKITHEKNFHSDIKNHILPFKFNNETLRCTICANVFSKFRPLVNHMHIHYRNFICTICDAGFVNRNAFTQHADNHKAGSFACDYCPKVYKTIVRKRLHERTAHTHVDMMYKCGYCTETFKDYGKKETHLVEVHGVKSLIAKCKACDKVYSTRKLLSIHVKRDHLMERPHKCSECEMSFFSTTGLKNHMVKHTGSRTYKCAVCLKSYGRKKTLNSHMRVHEEHRFKCEHCSRAFVQKCSWKSHMRSKHGEVI